MKKKILVIITVLLILSFSVTTFILLNKDKNQLNKNILGVWWWDNRIDDTYLNYAQENGVTEIYYYASSFNNKIADFIEKANSKDIKVYWLTGKYEYIENPSLIIDKIDSYLDFQNKHKHNFAGIHFDIEPHQHPEFDTRREEIILNFVKLTSNIRSKYLSLYLEYDLPCWLEDEITYNGITKPAFAHIFDYSNKITFMSYRDSAEKILDFAKSEIEYANQNNKSFNLSVETQDVEDDTVTFFEEGKSYMNTQLKKLRRLLFANNGIAIHHIISWVELKE